MDMTTGTTPLKIMATGTPSLVKSKTNSMEIDDHTNMVPMDVDSDLVSTMHGTRLCIQMNNICSAKPPRTKPLAKNKFQKRLGAKKAKKLELDERLEFILGAEDATMYRALSARCNDLAQDRPDIGFASMQAKSCEGNVHAQT